MPLIVNSHAKIKNTITASSWVNHYINMFIFAHISLASDNLEALKNTIKEKINLEDIITGNSDVTYLRNFKNLYNVKIYIGMKSN